MRHALLSLLLAALPARGFADGSPAERRVAQTALEKARAAQGPDHFALATWHSDALSGDLLGDPGDARVGLQLPAREQECLEHKTKCWLVIYLPGFDATPEQFHVSFKGAPPSALAGKQLEAWKARHGGQPSLTSVLQELDARAGAAPIVVVVPDGRTRLGGGWYVDSPVSGNWETFVMQVLLPAARDALAPGTPASRTLVVGHSMGGFGALHLGMAHPASFHAVAAFNPTARTADLADEALARLDAHGQAPDAEARLRDGDSSHFFDRLLLSLGGAFFADPKAPHGLAPLFDPAKHPWRLNPAARTAFERFDVGLHAQELAPLARVQLYAGRADPLVPLPEVQEIADAANGKATRPAAAVGIDGGAKSAGHAQVELVATDGNHLSHLAQDLKQALETLTR